MYKLALKHWSQPGIHTKYFLNTMQTNVLHANNLRLSQVTSFRAVLNSNECRHDNKYVNFHTMQSY